MKLEWPSYDLHTHKEAIHKNLMIISWQYPSHWLMTLLKTYSYSESSLKCSNTSKGNKNYLWHLLHWRHSASLRQYSRGKVPFLAIFFNAKYYNHEIWIWAENLVTERWQREVSLNEIYIWPSYDLSMNL